MLLYTESLTVLLSDVTLHRGSLTVLLSDVTLHRESYCTTQ